MACHLFVAFGTIPSGVATRIAAVPDIYPSTTSPVGVRLPAWKIVAAFASGVHLTHTQLVAPSFSRVGNPFVRPVQRGALRALTDPNFCLLFDRPLRLELDEVLSALMTQDAGIDEEVAVALWVADKIDPVPEGDAFWVEYTSTTSADAGAWRQLDIQLETLPEGEYAITGMEHSSQSCIAARLVLPGLNVRPGVLGIAGTYIGTRAHRAFYEGRLGLYGTFKTSSLPKIETLISTGTDTDHIGYLRVVRVA